jgi:type IV secretory pathway VirB10-like protein
MNLVVGLVVIVGGVVLLPVQAAAETQAEQFGAWLCARVPSMAGCSAWSVPLPPTKPVEIVPVPEAPPAVTQTPAWPQPPKFEPVPVTTAPPQAAPELQRVQPKAEPPKQADRSKLRERVKTKQKQEQQPQTPKVEMDDSPVSCGEVRFGAGMSCDIIRANSYKYDRYTDRKKRASRACLTAAQIKGIEDCFPEKKRR